MNVQREAILPALQALRKCHQGILQVDNDVLLINAWGQEILCRIRLDTQDVPFGFETSIPMVATREIIATVDNQETIGIEADDAYLHLTFGKCRCSLRKQPVEDVRKTIPVETDATPTASVQVPVEQAQWMLAAVASCVAIGTHAQGALAGVSFRSRSDGGVTLCGTDTYRLLLCDCDANDDGNARNIDCVIPPALADAASTFIEAFPVNTMRINVLATAISIEGVRENGVVWDVASNKLPDKYPDVGRFIDPEKYGKKPFSEPVATLQIGADKMISAINSALKIGKHDYRRVTISSGHNEVIVSSTSENGKASLSIELDDETKWIGGLPRKSFSTALNGSLLASALRTLPDETVIHMIFRDNQFEPTLVVPADGSAPGWQYIQMPMQGAHE